MILHISKPYLWLPINKSNPEVKLHFFCDDMKFQEVDIQLGSTIVDFYTCMDVSKYLDRDIEIKGDISQEQFLRIFCHDEEVQNMYPFRPLLHFAPEIGWHNDPNGLIYADGIYHLYYQWNPYGVIWGNMHWGHAVSKDMITWEHKGMVMEPDQYGPVFSGCAWQDKENVAGYGKDTLLFFYTASGGNNQWSIDNGNKHTQSLAISTDVGTTLQKIGVVLENITESNRDPKIFYHKESSAYIMVLFMDDYDFAIFRSTDLLHWTQSQRFSAKGMRECPDLFELSVTNSDNEKKWVFWSADGYYMVGNFDGYRFTAESEILSAYCSGLPYAAQTYAGVKDRVISVAWHRMENDRGNYRGLMSLPAELSLKKIKDKYKICFNLPKEFDSYRHLSAELTEKTENFETQLAGTPREITLEYTAQSRGITKLSVGDTVFVIDFDKGNLSVSKSAIYEEGYVIPFDNSEGFNLDLIVDQEIIEFYGNDGMIYGAVETEEDILSQKVVLETTAEIKALKVFCIQQTDE